MEYDLKNKICIPSQVFLDCVGISLPVCEVEMNIASAEIVQPSQENGLTTPIVQITFKDNIVPEGKGFSSVLTMAIDIFFDHWSVIDN